MAHSGVMVSLAGLAVTRLPATVPRLRICGAPTSQQARARGKACAHGLRRGHDLVVGDQRPQAQCFAVESIRSKPATRDIHQDLLLAHAAFQLQDQISPAHDQPAVVAMPRQ